MAPVTRRKALALLLTSLSTLAGCSLPPAPPTAERLHIVASPSAVPLVERLAARYRVHRSYAQVEVSPASADSALKALTTRRADLALIERALDPAELVDPERFRPWLKAWTIAEGGVAFVVHPSSPLENLSRDELRRVFEGHLRRWSALGGSDSTIILVTREAGAPARLVVEREVLQARRIAGTALVLPSDQAVADYVARHPEAIGYVSMAWLREDIRAIGVDGVLPTLNNLASRAYTLSHPVVIVSSTALAGRAKAFIEFCLGHEGDAITGQSYVLSP